MKLSALAAGVLLAHPSPSRAVLYGDEIYADVPGGKFWAFYTGGIAVIDPASCRIEDYITEDHEGRDLPLAFNDGIYMQNSDDSAGYVLIGSRVDETDPETGDTISHMYAISTTERKVISKAKVGYKAVHSYGVYPRDEFWMHSDGEGLFYVFDVDDLSQVSHDHDIEAKAEKPAHGKLLWDESPKLGDRGFATTTGETFLFEIDLASKKQVAAFDFSSYLTPAGSCRGLHAIAYSDVNQHVYAECSGSGGALEFDVSGGKGSIKFVQQFPLANGALYETPDGRFVVAASKGQEAWFVFKPRGSGVESSVEYEVPVPGHPSTVSFYTDAADDVVACSPLTENLNKNQWHDGKVVCSYASCTGAASVEDVNNGICYHDDESEESPLKLKRVLTSDDATHPACARCLDATNFETADDGTSTCTCTPHCGSCDPNPAYSDEGSGYRCLNLSDYVRATDSGAKLPKVTLIGGTGGMHQGSPYGSSDECTFGRTYRTHKRGMKYDASVSNVPTHSVVIVDMEKMEKKCAVALPEGGAPRKVLYAPSKPVPREELVGSLGSGSVARSASWALAAAGAVLVLGF